MAHDAVAVQLTAALRGKCNLAIHDFDVLLYLRLNESREIRMQDLSEAVPLSQPALSRLVARLAERNLLERRHADHDGRVTLIYLTLKGQALADQAIQVQVETVHRSLTGHLSEAEQAQLLGVLDRIGSGGR